MRTSLITGGKPFYQASDRQLRGEQTEQDPATQESQIPLQETEEFTQAVETIENEIQRIADKGEQGAKIASDLREVVSDSRVTLGEMAVSFRVAEVMSEILPQRSDYSLNFLDVIKGGYEQGRRVPGLKAIELAYKSRDTKGNLVFDREVIQETSSHEAFHVLQDYFKKYDKNAHAILEKEFGSINEKVDYLKTKSSKWIKRYSPKLHDDLVRMNQRNDGINGSELQAYAFSAFDRARREGKTPVMAGGIRKFFRFISEFLERLYNKFQGLGFQSAEDIFQASATGVASRSFGKSTLILSKSISTSA